MRWALDAGQAEALRLPREFIVAVPSGGNLPHRNPRPFSDDVLRALSDPANVALLAAAWPVHQRVAWVLCISQPSMAQP